MSPDSTPETTTPVPQAPAPSLDALQFQKVEYADNRPACVLCKSKIEETYFHLAGQVVCPNCAEKTRTGQERPKGPWVMRGVLFGAGTALACSVVYAVITMVTGLELALISILVGFLIGRAVRIGSHGLGGRRLQIVAVTLTYLSITCSYAPVIIKAAIDGAKKEQAKVAADKAAGKAAAADKKTDLPKPSLGGFVLAVATLIGISLVSPLLGLSEGVGGLIGILIIFFGLSRAWRETARDERLLMGPYSLDEAPASA
jgi:hypothetical protein